jgi:hypothetical protein
VVAGKALAIVLKMITYAQAGIRSRSSDTVVVVEAIRNSSDFNCCCKYCSLEFDLIVDRDLETLIVTAA